MRILLIEDEERITQYLRKGLSESGFVVDVSGDGVDGLYLASEGHYEAVVLDLTLPGLDGLDVLRRLRSRSDVPVIILSARGELDDKVHGLTIGADDYLVKPFSFSELVARIQAVLRRGSIDQGADAEITPLRIGDLEVDLVRMRALRDGQALALTPREFGLLSLLLRRRGQVLTRGALAEQVWDINFHSEANVIDVAVRRLRAKLDDPFPRKLLHTVRGVGYVLEEREA